MLDTGQSIDTGQFVSTDELAMYASEMSCDSPRLAIVQHEIHRTDRAGEEDEEYVMSTLKAFVLRVSVQSDNNDAFDGKQLKATLIYENGYIVEEVSATLEPPLLGGEALIENGVASFKLKITVLSSLCRSSRFRVQVTAVDSPDLTVVTSPMRTITKLHRRPSVVGGKVDEVVLRGMNPVAGYKRGVDGDALECLDLDCNISSCKCESLWDKVRENGDLLKKLKQQQLMLSSQLTELRELHQA